MPFRQLGSLRIFEFETLSRPGLVHAIFTRQGGVSPAPWQSLNVGATVGDDRERVIENRRRAFAAVGREWGSLHDVWQVHSADIVLAGQPRGDRPLVQADGLISATPAVTLFMRFADCVPILLFDPRKQAVGLVHAGWLGTVRRIASLAVRSMGSAFGSNPADILAGVGPSIGPDHYPVGEDVVLQVREAFGSEADRHLRREDGRVSFDLWTANQVVLEQAGIGSIEMAGVCTACHPEDWYSHRGDQGRTGRFGGLIALSG
jgi:YfiH family protein